MKKKPWTPQVGERVLVEATVVHTSKQFESVLVWLEFNRWSIDVGTPSAIQWLSDIRPIPQKRRKGKG